MNWTKFIAIVFFLIVVAGTASALNEIYCSVDTAGNINFDNTGSKNMTIQYSNCNCPWKNLSYRACLSTGYDELLICANENCVTQTTVIPPGKSTKNSGVSTTCGNVWQVDVVTYWGLHNPPELQGCWNACSIGACNNCVNETRGCGYCGTQTRSSCGDGTWTQCKGAGTCARGIFNSVLCPESTSSCNMTNHKLGTRGVYGNCGSSCTCYENPFIYSCVKNQCGATAASQSDCPAGHVYNPQTCSCDYNPSCGNNIVDAGEQCELPSTNNNAYCNQTTERCVDYKLQTRDSKGNCNSTCLCAPDQWNAPQCVKNQCGATAASQNDCAAGHTYNPITCACDYSPTCGNNILDAGEQCELPSTANNAYCSQTTNDCLGVKLGTRDSLGNCTSQCGCNFDQFTYACVKNQCGATAASQNDCQAGYTFNPVTCACDYNPSCGNNQIDNGEQCELPSTSNNAYCSQTTENCVEYKLQTRDTKGNCGVTCQCIPDQWNTPQCVKDKCDAHCTQGDTELGNNSKLFSDYCNSAKLVDYNHNTILDTTTTSCCFLRTCDSSCTMTGNCTPTVLVPTEMCSHACAADATSQSDCQAGYVFNPATCACDYSPGCGNNIIDAGEQCELPSAYNNAYCSQTTQVCNWPAHTLGMRDSLGNCSASCLCGEDNFVFSCSAGNCGATASTQADCAQGYVFNPQTCGCDYLPSCGNGLIDNGEQCELPSTANNTYCAQSTSSCNGTKQGIRDNKGNCSASCGCNFDPFAYNCVKNQCGATAASQNDCAAGYEFNPSTCACDYIPVCAPGNNQTRDCALCGSQSKICLQNGTWADWGSCTDQGVCEPGSSRPCQDNCIPGSQTCLGNCQWDSCKYNVTCLPGELKNLSCGNCGVKFSICLYPGQWSSFTQCLGEGVCSSGSQDSRICQAPFTGNQTRACSDKCQWNEWGNCTQICAPGETQTCGNCGIKSCGSNGQWSICQGQGSCAPGSVDSCSIGSLTGSKVCSQNCQWSDCDAGCKPGNTTSCGNCGSRLCLPDHTWSTCSGEGCQPGSNQTADCGLCGTKTRVCGQTCAWTNWGSCNNQGTCAPGAEETRTCNVGQCGQGTQTRTCSYGCGWDSWSDCVGTEPAICGNCLDDGHSFNSINGTLDYVGNYTQFSIARLKYQAWISGSTPLIEDCQGQSTSEITAVASDGTRITLNLHHRFVNVTELSSTTATIVSSTYGTYWTSKTGLKTLTGGQTNYTLDKTSGKATVTGTIGGIGFRMANMTVTLY